MSENLFDHKIKEALERIEPPYDPASWDVLAKKMDALQNPVPVDEVDKVVARGLQNFEPSYQPAHWNLLVEQMENLAAVRFKIIVSKVAEAALLCLLIWNFGNLTFGEKYTPPPAPPKPKFNGPVAENSRHRSHQNAAILENAAGQILPEMPLAETNLNAAGTDVLPVSNANLGAAEGQFFPENFEATFTLSLTFFENENPPFAAPLANFASLNLLPTGNIQPIPNPEAAPKFASLLIKKHKEKNYYISNYASFARNHVQTPANTELQSDAYAQWTNGYGGGLAVGYRRGKWTAEAGAQYLAKNSLPRTAIEIAGGNPITGYQGVTLAEVNFDVLALPVKVSRQMAKKGRTSLHLSAGATANLVAQSAYHYRQIEVPNQIGTQPPTAKFDVGRGIFEGGSASQNTWVTADAGLRLERRLTPKFTAFVEPMYSVALAGNFGPRRSKFDGLTVNAGVMARI